ncbi:MAG: prepilin-type N-terminal cleavage/methylation domain-containing protein [Phycisphaerae bacterium]|nr:prepilin-type N-terminal cleavage/methylation domain-containing protein [Phycisphaerae bacterium]
MKRTVRHFQSGRRRGFTLAEVLMATVVLGVGMAAIMGALRAGTQVNSGASDMSRAVLLGQELRERIGQLPFSDPDAGQAGNSPGLDESSILLADDMDDYDGQVFSPPISSMGDSMTDLSTWSQAVDISWKNDNNIAATVGDGSSNTAYVKITIRNNNEVVLTTGWIVSQVPTN